MKTLKYILFFLVNIWYGMACVAQQSKLDSLRKILPTLRDSQRINCLNGLSKQCVFLLKLDTARQYAASALEESKKINYLNGLAQGYSMLARVAFKSELYDSSIILLRTCFEYYEKTPNKTGMHQNYLLKGWTHVVKGDWENGIRYFATCNKLSTQVHDSDFIFYSVGSTAMVYMWKGDYERAFEKAMQVRQLAMHSHNREWKTRELELISDLYKAIEDYKSALYYLRQFLEIKTVPLIQTFYDNYDELALASLFSVAGQFDSAKYHFGLIDSTDIRKHKTMLRFYQASLGKYYALQNRHDEALYYYLLALKENKQRNDEQQIMKTKLSLADVYLRKKDYTSAYRYAKEGLVIAIRLQARHLIRDAYRVFYTVYNQSGQVDSAYAYYQRFVLLKDSVFSDQVKAKLIAYDFDQKIELLNKEKEKQAIKLKQQIQQAAYQKGVHRSELQKETFLKKSLIFVIVILLLLAFIVFRYLVIKRKNEAHRRFLAENQLNIQKLESDRSQATLLQQKAELEMEVLRAQMNPHFISNSLNSINRFILQNDKGQASQYLTKFSRLVRLILQNSHEPMISLESELDSLQLYLELEAVRFDDQFSYRIDVSDELDISMIKLPPLIIQPYAENAIWHGLMHKEEKGHLQVTLFQDEETLFCKITDDGVGRKKAAEMKSKSAVTHKSMGMHITNSRIEMLHHKKEEVDYITVTDLVLPDGGAGGTA